MIPPDILKSNRDLTPGERYCIKQLAQDTATKLKPVQEALAKLKQEEKELLETANNCQLALAPIRMLPRDVISEIFLECVRSEEPSMSPKKAPVLLTCICSAFRDIALSMPTLWATIPVMIPETFLLDSNSHLKEEGDEEENDEDLMAHIKLYLRSQVDAIAKWLCLSENVPLSIECKIVMDFNVLRHFEDEEYALAEVLLKSAARWCHLSLQCKTDSLLSIEIMELASENVPLLTSLHLHVYGLVSCDMFQARKLTELSLVGGIDPSSKQHHINWPKLTRLNLSLFSPVADTLRQARGLVHLSLSVNRTEGNIDDICLPHLRELTVREELSHYRGNLLVADYIKAPALETLHTEVDVLLLTNLVKRSPHLRNLEILNANPDQIRAWLCNCPQITSCVIKAKYPQRATGLLEELVLDQGGTYTCPNLLIFHYNGLCDVSFDVLCQFLGAEHGGSDTPLQRKWEQVDMKVFITDWGSNDEKAKVLNKLVDKLKRAGVLQLKILSDDNDPEVTSVYYY